MSDWLKEALKPEETVSGTTKPVKRNWVKEVLQIGPAEEPPLEPQYRFGSEQKPASFGTQTKTEFVDDTKTKIDIYAKARGISPSRYMVKDGDIYYLADDGLFYKEEVGGAKGIAASTLARSPSLVLGTTLSPAGPLAAGLGAAGGEGIRKSIGALAFGEPQTSGGNIVSMGKEGVVGAAGESLGRLGIRAIDTARGGKAANVIRLAGSERKYMVPREIKRIEDLGKKYGIELWTPQTTKSNELISRWNLLGDLPVTADKVGRLRLKQYKEINDAVERWLNTFGPPTTTAGSAGRKVVLAAGKSMKAAEAVRRKQAGPLYKKAFTDNPDVDISPVIEFIDSKLTTAKGKIRDGLLNAKKILMKPDLEEGAEVLDTSLKGLHDAKLELDDLIAGGKQSGLGNTARYNYREIKKRLIKAMGEASEDYDKARKIFASESEVVEQVTTKKGIVGKLAKLEGDDVEKAAKMILSPSASSPEIAARAKAAIIKHAGKKEWEHLVRVHLKEKFREVVKTGTTNIGGQLRKRLFGDISQQEILRVAMDPVQYKNFNDLMEVFERTASTAGRESTTAPRLVSLSQMAEEAGGVSGKVQRVMGHPLFTWKRALIEFRAKLRTEKYQDMLLDVMSREKTSKQIQRMLQLKPGSQDLIKSLSTFLTLEGVGEYGKERTRQRRKDIPFRAHRLLAPGGPLLKAP